ncbi:MAG: phytanoyl-CoA dioxygenase family protein [Pseudomonadota bacterium]
MAHPLVLVEGRMPDALCQRYRQEGFVSPLQAVSADQAQTWRAALEEIEGDWLTADLPHPLNQYKRVNAHVVMPLAAEIASCPAILDAVESVLGENLLVWSCEFFIKEAGTTHIVSWHQDLTYWGLGATDGQCTAWLALSSATVDSGCMRFVAGSHHQAIVPHQDTFADNNLLSRGQEIAVEVDEDEATDIILQPGQMSLHHGLTFHASGPNRSDDRRIGVAIRYITPEVKQEVADRDYAMLVRGRDTTGNFTLIAQPAALFDPAALRLYDEIRGEQAKALAAGAGRVKLYASSAG